MLRITLENRLRATDVALRRSPAPVNCESDTLRVFACREKDSNLRRRLPADLQSASFGRSDIPAHTETVRVTHGLQRNLSQPLEQCPTPRTRCERF